MKKKSVNLSVGRGEKSKKGGLTAKGRAKYNKATGSNLKAPVTAKQASKSKTAAARRKSFCARMSGELHHPLLPRIRRWRSCDKGYHPTPEKDGRCGGSGLHLDGPCP